MEDLRLFYFIFLIVAVVPTVAYCIWRDHYRKARSAPDEKKQVAVIGTEGAGKTVFLSVLAMRHRTPGAGRVWIEYKNRETQQRVTETWDTLARQDWPPSTPAGTLSRIEWGFHTSDGAEHGLRVCDPAGQDFRRIFEQDGKVPPGPPLLPGAPAEPPGVQEQLRRMLETADVILFLINLRDVTDAQSMAEVDNIEIPIKLALDSLLRRGASAALVLTQHDLIVDRLKQVGLNPNDAIGAVHHFLPQVGGALQLGASGRIHVCFVAAVGETVPHFENGSASRRPKPGFSSEGLPELVGWLESTLKKRT